MISFARVWSRAETGLSLPRIKNIRVLKCPKVAESWSAGAGGRGGGLCALASAARPRRAPTPTTVPMAREVPSFIRVLLLDQRLSRENEERCVFVAGEVRTETDPSTIGGCHRSRSPIFSRSPWSVLLPVATVELLLQLLRRALAGAQLDLLQPVVRVAAVVALDRLSGRGERLHREDAGVLVGHDILMVSVFWLLIERP